MTPPGKSHVNLERMVSFMRSLLLIDCFFGENFEVFCDILSVLFRNVVRLEAVDVLIGPELIQNLTDIGAESSDLLCQLNRRGGGRQSGCPASVFREIGKAGGDLFCL